MVKSPPQGDVTPAQYLSDKAENANQIEEILSRPRVFHSNVNPTVDDRSVMSVGDLFIVYGDIFTPFVVDDKFNDSSLDADKFGTVVSGGSAVEGSSGLVISSTLATQGTLTYRKKGFTKGVDSATIIEDFQVTAQTASNYLYPLYIEQKAIAPTLKTTSNLENILCWIAFSGGNQVKVYYKNASNADVLVATISVALNTTYKAKFILTTTSFQLQLLDASGTILGDTGAILWANAVSYPDPIWLSWGDVFTDLFFGSMKITQYTEI